MAMTERPVTRYAVLEKDSQKFVIASTDGGILWKAYTPAISADKAPIAYRIAKALNMLEEHDQTLEIEVPDNLDGLEGT